MANLRHLISLLLTTACASQASHWTLDQVGGAELSRLRYHSQQAHPTLAFELVKFGSDVEAFLSLTRFRLKEADRVNILFTIDQETFSEEIAVHEGKMRLKIPPETSARLIQALQDGHKIGILLDDFEETLDPGEFPNSYAKFLGGGYFFEPFLKGPVP